MVLDNLHFPIIEQADRYRVVPANMQEEIRRTRRLDLVSPIQWQWWTFRPFHQLGQPGQGELAAVVGCNHQAAGFVE
jgi:hypothetical protein